ncbi:MAG TPA: hypothetical protein VJ927_08120 [Actinomycetota bacterium]|nr:hypothetical protein [Actinomycetota bacterium]
MSRAVPSIVVALLVLGSSPAAAGSEQLPYRDVAHQSRGGDGFKWRAYATNRSELRSAWKRFHMRGDLPRIGFEHRVAILAGTGGSSSCPPDLAGLRLHREERRIVVRIDTGSSGPGACTDDFWRQTWVVSVRRSDVPRGDLAVRVYRAN